MILWLQQIEFSVLVFINDGFFLELCDIYSYEIKIIIFISITVKTSNKF